MNKPTVEIRLALPDDLEAIMPIFDAARSFMAATGNPNQWISGYPQRELILREIQEQHCYVCLSAGRIVATFCFIVGEDPTYRHIDDGAWLDDSPYAVLHRLASDGSVAGIADQCLAWCFRHTSNLRVDTHHDNRVLQHILRKHGFHYCGIIYVANGTPRLAFQKKIH